MTDIPRRKTKVLHIINCLDPGGAENMLANVLAHMNRDRFEAEVVSLTDKGSVAAEIEGHGIPVRGLFMNRFTTPISFLALAWMIFRSKPDVIQTWMYHSNLLGSLAAKLAGGIPVVWGVHATRLDPSTLKFGTYVAIRGSKAVSRWAPARIVYCSMEAQQFHESLGFGTEGIRFIPNGFDLDRFHPIEGARQLVRRELGLDEDALLIGLITRYHPNKDHANFLNAAALLRQRMPDVHFVCCGRGVTRQNRVLAEKMVEHDLGRHVQFLGERQDIPRLTAALDVATSSSFIGEAFPLALGEAMACGVPCVTTDVGDSATLVGNTGRVVPTRNPKALADAWEAILNMGTEEWRALGNAARKRIADHYSIESISKKYEEVYEELNNLSCGRKL